MCKLLVRATSAWWTLAFGAAVWAQVPVEYSNAPDEQAVVGGGAHGALDPQQILYTVPPDVAGPPAPWDAVDYGGAVEVDAAANRRDAYFNNLRGNSANLLVSFAGDMGSNAVYYETPGGLTGLAWTQANFSNPDPAGDVEDVDGLELWGPWGGSDANCYSEQGDPTNFSVCTNFAPWLAVPRPTILSAVRFLGYVGPDAPVDVDAFMLRRGPNWWYSAWGPGARVIFSIRDTTAAGGNFDGGEIIVLQHGGRPTFLMHGGHAWNTAFNVAVTFGVNTEDVDAIEAVPPPRYMIVLVDRSGSMSAIRATGNTRCADARTAAIADVNDFFASNPSGLVAVWTFADDEPTALTGFGGQSQAIAALSALTPDGCTGSTPLAEAICDAVDELTSTFPTAIPGDRLIAVSSDGGETSSSGECCGVDDPTPPYAPNSWQYRVTVKLQGGAVALVRYWNALAKTEGGLDPESGEPLGGRDEGDDLFFQNLAAVSGGHYLEIDDADDSLPPEVTGACLLSTDGGCADITEFSCVALGGAYQGDETTCADFPDNGIEDEEPAPPLCGDCDCDGDVDVADFAAFQTVFTGPGPG